MAPTPSPFLIHSPNRPSGSRPHRLRRQGMNFLRHLPRSPSAPRIEQPEARSLDTATQPSAVLDGPPPPPVVPMPSASVALTPEPSAIPNDQPQGLNTPADIPGNIVAAVVVIVLILGGLIGLVVGGEMIRRRTKAKGKKVSRLPPGCSRRRKFELTKNATSLPHQHTSVAREKFPCDEKTLTPLARPPSVLSRQRQRRLSDVWPIRSFSMAVSNRLSCPVQVERSLQHSPPMRNPHTTWSEFSPALPYVAPARTVLACIPEELEDSQSHTNSDLEAILGITFQRSLEFGSVVLSPQAKERKPSQEMIWNAFDPSAVTERHSPRDCQVVYKRATGDEDSKSLGSSAPDMTSDGGDSSRSSMASLESLEDGKDRESLGEEVFELRRAQTRSMQMNKGVLLSLSLRALGDDDENSEATHEERGPSRPSSVSSADGGLKDYGAERRLSLAMLGGNLSTVNLDEFPSPPSILPMIPSFISGF